METIINNIADPSWWFTGLFFVAIAYLMPKIIHFISSIPIHAEGIRRKYRLRMLKKIKGIRFDDVKVITEGNKTSSWMAVFVLSIVVLFYIYLTEASALSSLDGDTPISNDKRIVYFLMSIPLYIVEMYYLRQKLFFERLMKYRGKLCITSRSCD